MILKVMEQQIIKVKSSKQNQQARHIRYRQKNVFLFPKETISSTPVTQTQYQGE